MKKKSITTSELDHQFDEGENIAEYLDLDNASRHGLKQRRMIKQLDVVARRLGVIRQSIIKIFISEKLKENDL